MLTIRDTLLWYKRLDVRKAMLEGARNKEIGIRYGDGFGKRPDALEYEQDILEAVQNGATSFHASEEIWSNPRNIDTKMSKKELDELRTGWDLVLDVDFTDFTATKHITEALCAALEKHGLKHFGVKFSGNKGFHIGIAWESFPEHVDTMETRTLFPDLARQIASYLVHAIDNPENNFALSEKLTSLIAQDQQKTYKKTVCVSCGRDRIDKSFSTYFACKRCGHTEATTEQLSYLSCSLCNSFMERVEHETKEERSKCVCGTSETRSVFDLKIDTQLIAARHLYRLEYSLHEKSGLVSLVIPRNHVLSFEREEASAGSVRDLPLFWHRNVQGQGATLISSARKFRPHDEAKKQAVQKEIVWDSEAAPEESFPPTIKKMLLGMTDGKKRALFILTNFLGSVGWNADMIEQRLREWNSKNNEPLRENDIVSHLRYHRQRGQAVLPPNFENDIYKDLGVLEHDELSVRVKNPVQYVRMKMKRSSPARDKHKDKKPST